MDVRTTHVIYTDECTIMFGDIRGSVWNLERVNGQEREFTDAERSDAKLFTRME